MKPRPVPLALDADSVQWAAARIQTAAELLEDVLAEGFTGNKDANRIFRDALVFFLQKESSELEAGARGALKGKDGWPAASLPEASQVRPLFEGLGK